MRAILPFAPSLSKGAPVPFALSLSKGASFDPGAPGVER
jgi:hypothetical protein